MNSHIVEKTMHSIKNIDRLTDLAAIDVYNTTHDTINKYEIMKEHATEEYTNESFYQESVLAGVLIGAGVLGVAISAFFIIKKIIDSKDSADSSVKSADGKMVAAQVDLSDPKSTEKYLADLKARLEKLTETKSIKVTKSINKDEFAAAEKKINTWSEQLQEMIDNKHEAAEIEKIIDGMDISSVDVSKIFVNNEVDASVADFVEALGLRSISSFAGLLTSLKKKIDDVEKMVNNKKDKEAENAVQISQDHLTKLKNQNNDAAKLIAALKSQSKETLSETDKAVLGAINAETEAKKTEEPKTEEKPAGDGAAENKTETDKSKLEVQPSAGAGSGADDKGETKKQQTPEEQARLQKNTSTLIAIKNALSKYLSVDECEKIQSEIFHEVHDEDGTGIKDILMRYHNDIKSNPAKYHVSSVDDAELVMGNIHKMAMTLIDNCKIMYDPKVAEKAEIYITGNNLSEITTFNNADFNQGEPKADESKAEEPKVEEPKTEESKAEEPATEEQPKQISPEDRQIIDEIKDLIKANNSVTDASILLRMMSSHAKATDSQIKSCTAIAREELKNEPQTEVKSENQEDKNKIDDRQIIDEIKGLLKSDPSISDSDLILKTMTNHAGATNDRIKSCIATASKELKAENPPTPTENSEYPDDALINEKPEFKEGLINDLADYMKRYPDQSDDEAFQVRGFNTLKISPEMAKELKTSARELANKGSSQDTPTETEEPKPENPSEPEKKPEDQVKTEPENPPTSENSSEESKQSENTDDRQLIDELKAKIKQTPDYLDKFKRNPDDVPDNFDWWTQYVADGPYICDQYDHCLEIAYNELLKENPTDNPPTPKDQNTDENSQETTTGTSTEEPETKPEGENSPAAEETENSGEKKWSVSKIIELAKSGSDKVFELLSAINNDAIENDVVPKKIFETGLMDAAAVMALPMDYKTRLLATFESNNSLLGTVKSIINEIKNGDRSAVNKLKNINVNDELTTGNDVSDFITSIIPRVKSAFDSIIAKYNTPEMKEKRAQDISNIEQNVAAFFNKIKETCAGLFNKDKALAKVNELETVVEGKIHHLDPKYSGKREGLPNYGSNGKGINIGGHTSNGQTSGLIDGVPENEINRQQRQLESLSNNKIQAPAQFNPSAPADWNDRMEALGKTGIPNKQVPEPKTAPTPLNPAAPTEWNDNMNALKSAGAENISQKTEVPPIAPIDTDADIAKAKEEKAQLDALQQHRQEQLAQFKAERAQREQQVRDAYAQDAQARQNAMNEELAKQSQEDEQKKAQAEELTKANEDANVAEAIRQAEEEKKALERGKNLSVSPQSTESLDNAAKLIAMQDFIKNFKDPAWREAHPGVVSWQELYNSEDYKNEAIMKAEAERMKNEKLAENRAGIQFIKEQNYEAIVPSLNKVLKTTPDDKTITRYLDGLKTAYAKILMQYQQNPGNARKIIEDYSKNGAAPYEFYTVPYNELRQTQLIDWQQRLFNEKVELDKDRKRNRKKIKAVDKIIDKLIELDELLKTSVHNVIAAATKNPMRALEAALVMFQESDEEIIAGLTAIENFINKADEVKASEEEADNTPENPAEEPSDEEVSQSILSILKS